MDEEEKPPALRGTIKVGPATKSATIGEITEGGNNIRNDIRTY